MASNYAHLAVLLMLVASAASTFGAELQPTKLASWLPKESTSVQTFSDYYERADTTQTCLRLTTAEHCDIIGLLSAFYYESQMTCCDKGDSKYDSSAGSFLPFQTNIGKCAWTIEPFLLKFFAYLFGGPPDETVQIGRFSVQCDFNGGAEACSEGLWDDMILEANGPMYFVPNAAIIGQPNLQDDALSCFIDTRRAQESITGGGKSSIPGLNLPDFTLLVPTSPHINTTELRSKDITKEQALAKAKLAYDKYTPDDTATYYSGLAIVVNGPVEVTNRRTKAKYDDGYMQTVLRYYPDGNPDPITPTSQQYIADPFRFDLVLNKKDSGYKF